MMSAYKSPLPAARGEGAAKRRVRGCVIVALFLVATASFAQPSPYDQLANALMSRYNLPAGAIGVVHDGRLVFVRGYGQGRPRMEFDIASVTKPITSAA